MPLGGSSSPQRNGRSRRDEPRAQTATAEGRYRLRDRTGAGLAVGGKGYRALCTRFGQKPAQRRRLFAWRLPMGLADQWVPLVRSEALVLLFVIFFNDLFIDTLHSPICV